MITKKQKQVFDFVKAYHVKYDYAPSLDEIKRKFKLASVSTAHYYIKKLKEAGQLNKERNQPRSVVLRGRETMVKIPFWGIIAAGEPIEVIENRETIAIPKSRIPKSSEVYALRVQGDSMIDEGVNDGDTILINKQNAAENGDKVVALLNGNEATLKTFYREKGQIRLQPANKNYKPIIIKSGQQLALQGVLLDVFRTDETERSSQDFVLPVKKNTQQQGKISDYLNKVYNGDVMHVLKDLPDNSVDMVFGDPDYNVGIKYGENNYTNVGHTPKRFTTAHRSILHVRKNADNKFFKDDVALPYKNPTDKRIQQNLANGSKGRMPYSWFEFNLVKNVSREKTEHACQIPQKLTELLIKASTKEGDIVFPLFGGSGAEVEVAKKLKRNFLTAELNPRYCKIIEDRLQKGYIDNEYRLGPRGKKKTRELSSAYWLHQNGSHVQ